ncbi:MAG TPA: molybdenum cofactor biosynthesis protein MoaE [Methanomicrobia archaeon]|nr:molybdenum cofactor biosynthesis protein MoaE [Methanomicrobia archaeon]
MIVNEEFAIDELVRDLKRPEMGAIVMFLGMVRGDKGVRGMRVEGDERAAADKLELMKQDALKRFEIDAVEIAHRRAGSYRVGENLLLILVGAQHRKAAFRACEYLIDAIKADEPFVKTEF